MIDVSHESPSVIDDEEGLKAYEEALDSRSRRVRAIYRKLWKQNGEQPVTLSQLTRAVWGEEVFSPSELERFAMVGTMRFIREVLADKRIPKRSRRQASGSVR